MSWRLPAVGNALVVVAVVSGLAASCSVVDGGESQVGLGNTAVLRAHDHRIEAVERKDVAAWARAVESLATACERRGDDEATVLASRTMAELLFELQAVGRGLEPLRRLTFSEAGVDTSELETPEARARAIARLQSFARRAVAAYARFRTFEPTLAHRLLAQGVRPALAFERTAGGPPAMEAMTSALLLYARTLGATIGLIRVLDTTDWRFDLAGGLVFARPTAAQRWNRTMAFVEALIATQQGPLTAALGRFVE